MSLDQKRARANQLLREMGYTNKMITADTWEEEIVENFLHFND